ncbi:hypothetical protein B0H67DRAFT_598098 [Lasiosphaeris hirsuta]|uniref:Uncharacterized protein n=1 Tax=Lasiosphaeris hirsuta TaxID=260670 RepID=A0AA40AYT4_9PEZI|nr:hypothetical protein B0H67DRAFT_598098 [Lasiosphaeris hirsuta]
MASLIPDLDTLAEDLPPTYTESTNTTTTTTNQDLPPSLTSYYTSPITTHLSSLPSRLRAAQAAHLTTQASRDLDIITRLAPAVETFLRDLTSSARAPPAVAELTLIPAAAVPRGWALSGAAERRREGEAVRVVRVDSGKEDSKRSSGGASGGSKAVEAGYVARDDGEDDSDGDGRARGNGEEPGFDEWGRFNGGEGDGGESASVPTSWWYFRDERMARRLAGYLQPKAEVKTERRQIQQAVVDAKKQPSGWRWGRKKSGSESVSAPAAASPPPFSPSPSPAAETEDRVNMTVRAMEVTFRKENDFGVWESRNGFGIVVTVKVKQT